MNFPVALKYTQEHEWIKIEGDIAVVGITDFAQGELGDIVFVEVESVGKNIAKDGVFGTVEAVKTVSDLFLPVSGEVIEFNTSLFPSLDDVDIVDLLFFFNLFFPESPDYEASVRSVATNFGYQISDEEYSKGMPYITEYIQWLKEFQKK